MNVALANIGQADTDIVKALIKSFIVTAVLAVTFMCGFVVNKAEKMRRYMAHLVNTVQNWPVAVLASKC